MNDNWPIELAALREKNVIQDLDPTRLGHAVFVTCGDGDRFAESFNWYESLLTERKLSPRLHILALNGGPLNLAYPEAVAQGTVLKDQIQASLALKDMDHVVLMGHAPCGQAGVWGISLTEAISLLVRTKKELQAALGIDTAVHLHVDYGDGRMRTYHFSTTEWERLMPPI